MLTLTRGLNLSQHAAYSGKKFRISQVQLCIFVVAAALLGYASASPNENAFDFDYGFNPAVISMEMVDYADSEGTALRVPYIYLRSHPST